VYPFPRLLPPAIVTKGPNDNSTLIKGRWTLEMSANQSCPPRRQQYCLLNRAFGAGSAEQVRIVNILQKDLVGTILGKAPPLSRNSPPVKSVTLHYVEELCLFYCIFASSKICWIRWESSRTVSTTRSICMLCFRTVRAWIEAKIVRRHPRQKKG